MIERRNLRWGRCECIRCKSRSVLNVYWRCADLQICIQYKTRIEINAHILNTQTMIYVCSRRLIKPQHLKRQVLNRIRNLHNSSLTFLSPTSPSNFLEIGNMPSLVLAVWSVISYLLKSSFFGLLECLSSYRSAQTMVGPFRRYRTTVESADGVEKLRSWTSSST